MAKAKRSARNPSNTTTTSSTTTNKSSASSAAVPHPPLVNSLRELNSRLLSRVQTAERTAHCLESQHEDDIAAISALQHQLVLLEQHATDCESDMAAMRKVAAEREREMRAMRQCAESREKEMRELGERVLEYESQMREVREMVRKREAEVVEMRDRRGAVEKERGDLEQRVVEGEKVTEGLRERVKELEDGWGRRLSFSSIGSSWVGKGSPPRGGEVEVDRMPWWRSVWAWVEGLWRWLVHGREGEREPLLGRVA